MQWQEKKKDGVHFYQFDYGGKVRVYFLTRLGGYSSGNYHSLNLSFSVGDNPEAVRKNYEKIKTVLKIEKIITLNQQHSNKIIFLKKGLKNMKGDGILTTKKGIFLGIKVADCLPIVFFSESGNLVGVIHSGRQGLLKGICEQMAEKIKEKSKEKIYYLLLPSIEAKCYSVSQSVCDDFRKVFPIDFCQTIFLMEGEKVYLDLRKAARLILANYNFIELPMLGLCSFCEKDKFYSYRRDGITGRNLALVGIND